LFYPPPQGCSAYTEKSTDLFARKPFFFHSHIFNPEFKRRPTKMLFFFRERERLELENRFGVTSAGGKRNKSVENE
jgi:hypothetical protein